MTPLPSPDAQTWQELVTALAATARATWPAANGRLDKAVQLVCAGHVAVLPDGTAHVASQQPGDTTRYHVTAQTCECPDVPTAPEGLCKHILALRLATKATALLAQRQAAVQDAGPAGAEASAPVPPGRVPSRLSRGIPPADPAIADAVAQAERRCQAALDALPAAYRGFLRWLPRTKKVGGTKAQPLYATVHEPYLGVDGRVKMARDEHRAQGASLVMQTTFEVEPHSGQLLCRAIVTSALLGSVTAHARVFVGGSGVDAQNPLENAETSAIGRALGFLGYGVVGTGIASAEEVLQAQAPRPEADDALVVPANGVAEPVSPGGKPPSAKQQALLATLLRETGVPEDAVPAQLAQVTTSRAASLRIDQLRGQLRPREA